MLPPFALEDYLLKYEHLATLSLCNTGLDTWTMPELLSLADAESLADWKALKLGYSSPQGLPALREAICANYQGLSANQVLVSAGAAEGIACLFQALLEADDHAIVVTPCYQSLQTLPASICQTTEVALEADNGWHLELEKVRHAIQSNTRLIVINFPNNPTGAIPTQGELDELIQLAEKHGLYIVSDEVYRGMELTPKNRLIPMAERYAKGISVNSLSKAFGLPGLRIGWLATQDTALMARLLATRHYLTICVNTASERLALMALRAKETLLLRNLTTMRTNFTLFSAFMAQHADFFHWTPPKGGCIAFPKLLHPKSAEEFALTLLEEEKLLVLPGSLYQRSGNYLRLSFGNKTMGEGLERLGNFLRRF